MPPSLRVLALELGGQRDVEVGRCDEELVLALRAQQDVGEHRHRALAVGDALREAQAAKELVLLRFETPWSPVALSRRSAFSLL